MAIGAPYVVIDRDPCADYRAYSGNDMNERNRLAALCAVWRSDTPVCIQAWNYRQNGSRNIGIQQGLDRGCAAEMPLPVPSAAPVRAVRASEDGGGISPVWLAAAAVAAVGGFVLWKKSKKGRK